MSDHGHGSIPLCVDLDGTLLQSDSLWESLALLLKYRPLALLLVPLWLAKGKSSLKRELAARVTLDYARLPYNAEFLAFLQTEHKKGRPLVLATAADQRLAEGVASHLGIFEQVIGTRQGVNLAGRKKGEALARIFGEKGFDYAGNERRDVEVWVHARKAILVHAPKAVFVLVRKMMPVERLFEGRRNEAVSLLRALRPHQWLKNLLLFVPLLTAHQITSEPVFTEGIVAFVAFCFVTSSVYLLNDLLDLPADRCHPRKHRRPLAAGDLSLALAFTVIPLLLCCGIALAWLLPPLFLGVLLVYFFVTVAYSFFLKQIAVIDVLLLAFLYTIRIVAGHAATGIAYSFWLLLFSMFLFASLALMKRYAELLLQKHAGAMALPGRGYTAEDIEQIGRMGTASGYLSVLVFALYVNSDEVTLLYRHPSVLWLVCPLLLYWVSRIWLLADRGEVHEDPILFAMKDIVSYITGALVLLIVLLAT